MKKRHFLLCLKGEQPDRIKQGNILIQTNRGKNLQAKDFGYFIFVCGFQKEKFL